MARKKTTPMVEILDGLPANSEEMLVQKSWPLLALWRSDFTLPELKILDSYLARINSHNSDVRTVMFQKGELESILQVKRINFPDLRERMGHLMTPVLLQNENEFRQVALFEEAYCRRDEDGLWQVTLTCTNAALRYFFNIEDIGYLRYKLRSVASLGSRYSYVLFLYLEANRFRGSWEVTLDDLRRILRCEEESTYDSYKRFNDRLLKRCYQELTEKTELRFSYEPLRSGRSVTALRFTVESLNVLEQGSEQGSIFDIFDPEPQSKAGEKPAENAAPEPPKEPAPEEEKKEFSFYREYTEEEWASMTFEEMARTLWTGEEDTQSEDRYTDSPSDYDDLLEAYSAAERQELYTALCALNEDKLPKLGSLRKNRRSYLSQKLSELERRAAGGKIKNRYAYLLRMIRNEQR